jgi:excisionase family DNA binding protein
MTRISISQAAAQFGVSRRTVERWVRDGRLTAIPDAKDGRQRLVDPETVQLLIRQMPKRRAKAMVLEASGNPTPRGDDRVENDLAPVEIQDSQAIDKALVQVYEQHRRLLSRLDNDAVPALTLEDLRVGPLGHDLQRLAAYAQGQVSEPGNLVLAAVDSVLQVLYWPAAALDYTVPRVFWDTDLGRMLNRARLRAYKPNELVSIDDAARTFGVTTPTIYRWMDDRVLGWVRDDENGRTWVVRRDIDNLKRVAAEVAARQTMPERALAS